jgi:hypothetical protein
MAQCVKCGMRIGLFKTGGKLEDGERYYEVKQDPATQEKSAELKTISRYSSVQAGRLCKLCWAKWQAEQAQGEGLMAQARAQAAKRKAAEEKREEALHRRSVALERIAMSGAEVLERYASTIRDANRSEIMGLGEDGDTFGVRDYNMSDRTLTFFANFNGTVREWTIVRTGPTTWMIAATRSARRA